MFFIRHTPRLALFLFQNFFENKNIQNPNTTSNVDKIIVETNTVNTKHYDKTNH